RHGATSRVQPSAPLEVAARAQRRVKIADVLEDISGNDEVGRGGEVILRHELTLIEPFGYLIELRTCGGRLAVTEDEIDGAAHSVRGVGRGEHGHRARQPCGSWHAVAVREGENLTRCVRGTGVARHVGTSSRLSHY